MDGYSRLIQILKVSLPLAALGLLSTLFLLSDSVDPESTIPFAETEILDRIRGQQVTNPFFSGTTSKGEEITVRADVARPGAEDQPAEATNLRGRVRLQNGRDMQMSSDMGQLALNGDIATFTGNVVITSADGMRLETALLNTSLKQVTGNAPGEVRGAGPMGTLTAGAMEFGTENQNGPVRMLFTDGVKLIYVPQKSER